MGKTHLVGGMALGLATSQAVGAGSDPAFFIAVAAGSLLPDICHPSSKMGRKLPGVSHLINLIFGHRTFTHSLLFLILVSGLLYYFAGYAITAGMLIGMASHVLLDACTNSGVALFFPFKVKVRLPVTIQTGGIAENFVFASLVVVAGYLGYNEIAPFIQELRFL